ncbi:hypothetical protein YQE_09185, partial [Dendroctonus ponderosae]
MKAFWNQMRKITIPMKDSMNSTITTQKTNTLESQQLRLPSRSWIMLPRIT